MTQLCETCRFWFEDEPDAKVGECRHHSPSGSVCGLTGKGRPQWPPTTYDEWCGDHEELA